MPAEDVGNIRLGGHNGSSVYPDIVTWSEQQAALIRRVAAGEMVNDQLDWEHIAEEIEALGHSERSTLASNIATIIEHLAKLEASPATEPRLGWQETVLRVRSNIDGLLQESPGLRPSLAAVVQREHSRALRLVGRVLALHGETPQVPLEKISYTPQQVLGDWFPDV